MKFRVIQSNDRGLLTKVGDRTYARRKPAKGEEQLELPTLFLGQEATAPPSPLLDALDGRGPRAGLCL